LPVLRNDATVECMVAPAIRLFPDDPRIEAGMKSAGSAA
jgi:hypothetical protein